MSTQPCTAPTPGTAASVSSEARLAALEAKLDTISCQLQTLVDAQRPLVELANEMGPIASQVMSTSIDQLAHLEQRGYFDFARELKYLVERVVEDYDPRDLHELADNAANILDTVRTVTQPAVMALVRDATEALGGKRKAAPVGVFGAYRKIKRDKDIQRGLGFALDVLGRVGRAVARAPRMSRAELAELPGSTTGPTTTRAQLTAPASAPAPSCGGPVSSFVPDDQWNRDVATATAHELGVAELSDAHWHLVEAARAEYVKSGATPNIRKLTGLSGVSTREVYRLFPKAPGLTVARVAGVPKPVGCL